MVQMNFSKKLVLNLKRMFVCALEMMLLHAALDVDDEGDLVAVRTDAELAAMLSSHHAVFPLRIYISWLIQLFIFLISFS